MKPKYPFSLWLVLSLCFVRNLCISQDLTIFSCAFFWETLWCWLLYLGLWSFLNECFYISRYGLNFIFFFFHIQISTWSSVISWNRISFFSRITIVFNWKISLSAFNSMKNAPLNEIVLGRYYSISDIYTRHWGCSGRPFEVSA